MFNEQQAPQWPPCSATPLFSLFEEQQALCIATPLRPSLGGWGLVCFRTREPLSLSRMVQQDDSPTVVPLELTEYDYEYNDPRNTLHTAGPPLPTDAVIADGGCSRMLIRYGSSFSHDTRPSPSLRAVPPPSSACSRSSRPCVALPL